MQASQWESIHTSEASGVGVLVEEITSLVDKVNSIDARFLEVRRILIKTPFDPDDDFGEHHKVRSITYMHISHGYSSLCMLSEIHKPHLEIEENRWWCRGCKRWWGCFSLVLCVLTCLLENRFLW